MMNPGRVLAKSQILDHVWHYDFDGDSNVLETYISYLRRKLNEHGPPLIHTVRLVGYVLRDEAGQLTCRSAPACCSRCSSLRSSASRSSTCSRTRWSPAPSSTRSTRSSSAPIHRSSGRPRADAGRPASGRSAAAAPGFYVEVRSPDGDGVLVIPLERPGDEPTVLADNELPVPDGDGSDDEAVFASLAVDGRPPRSGSGCRGSRTAASS